MRPTSRARVGTARGDRRQARVVLAASLAANLVLAVALCLVWPQASRHLRQLEGQLDERIIQTQSQLISLRGNLQTMSTSLQTTKAQLASQAAVESLAAEQSKHPIEASGMPWLMIGITTVPRKSGADYLTRTLETLMEELPLDATDPIFGRVRVLVMNNRPGNHSVFLKMQQRLAGATPPREGSHEDRFLRKARLYISLVDNPGTVPDPAPNAPEPNDFDNPSNRPGREVRRQTCDLISMMQVAQNSSHYFMFMEDDFRVCPNALHIAHYALRKLNAQPKLASWLALRISYGMNGILLRGEHLQWLADYMRRHAARLPGDLLWMEWIKGRRRELWNVTKGRPLAVYRSNLLDHIGAHSSFAVRTNRLPWPGCFDPMATVWSLDKAERFQLNRCPKADISPCPLLEEGDDPWLKYPVDWPHILDGAEEDHPETLAETALNVTRQVPVQAGT